MSKMDDKKREKILESKGWTIDCVLPFELSHEDGSSAKGAAAHIVELAVIEAYNDEREPDFKTEATELIVGGLVEPHRTEALLGMRNLGLIEKAALALKRAYKLGRDSG